MAVVHPTRYIREGIKHVNTARVIDKGTIEVFSLQLQKTFLLVHTRESSLAGSRNSTHRHHYREK